MATRSYIGKALSNGNVKIIYCHFDGYLSGVGSRLKDYYTTTEQVDELLNGGDMSSLGDTINETCYYAAKGEIETDVEAREIGNWRITFSDSWCEYFYLYNPATSKWYYAKHNSNPELVQLNDL